eukprot:TRINITY_DN11684_c0_g3_i1.p1 TRINITY_DN11684_c0_g3~~TRINITY_DN11684_c0_g3_i1.p1  ORF type:complete len:989 (+),score=92.03 TRINITY_DN11684_c0_g3_i1:420-2969(+)
MSTATCYPIDSGHCLTISELPNTAIKLEQRHQAMVLLFKQRCNGIAIAAKYHRACTCDHIKLETGYIYVQSASPTCSLRADVQRSRRNDGEYCFPKQGAPAGSGSDLAITSRPARLSKVMARSSFGLVCQAQTSYFELEIRWTKDDSLLPSSNYRTSALYGILNGVQSIYVVDNVQPDDLGVYRCIAQAGATCRESTTTQLFIRSIAPACNSVESTWTSARGDSTNANAYTLGTHDQDVTSYAAAAVFNSIIPYTHNTLIAATLPLPGSRPDRLVIQSETGLVFTAVDMATSRPSVLWQVDIGRELELSAPEVDAKLRPAVLIGSYLATITRAICITFVSLVDRLPVHRCLSLTLNAPLQTVGNDLLVVTTTDVRRYTLNSMLTTSTPLPIWTRPISSLAPLPPAVRARNDFAVVLAYPNPTETTAHLLALSDGSPLADQTWPGVVVAAPIFTNLAVVGVASTKVFTGILSGSSLNTFRSTDSPVIDATSISLGAVESMLYLSNASTFSAVRISDGQVGLNPGANNQEPRFALWEKSTMRGMVAQGLQTIVAISSGNPAEDAQFILPFDVNGTQVKAFTSSSLYLSSTGYVGSGIENNYAVDLSSILTRPSARYTLTLGSNGYWVVDSTGPMVYVRTCLNLPTPVLEAVNSNQIRVSLPIWRPKFTVSRYDVILNNLTYGFQDTFSAPITIIALQPRARYTVQVFVRLEDSQGGIASSVASITMPGEKERPEAGISFVTQMVTLTGIRMSQLTVLDKITLVARMCNNVNGVPFGVCYILNMTDASGRASSAVLLALRFGGLCTDQLASAFCFRHCSNCVRQRRVASFTEHLGHLDCRRRRHHQRQRRWS